MIRRIILAALIVALAACAERVTPTTGSVEAGADNQLPPIVWRIRDQAELERIYREAGRTIQQGQQLHGFSARQGDVIVVYTLPPRNVDDQVTTTLGHEVMHVALGDFHR